MGTFKLIKLMDIVIDPSIQVREVEPYTVSKYAQAMREGVRFPPLILEDTSNRIVCGNHRYTAYKKVFNPETAVEVELMNFKGEAEIIRMAARDNSNHGRPLDTWDMKRIAIRLKELGDTPEEIAGLLSVPVKKINEWADMTVWVVGKKKKSKYLAPVKHGLEHLAGKKVNSEDYETHKKHDPGSPVKNMATVITRHIQSGWIDTGDEKTMGNLWELYINLKKFIETKMEKDKAA